jgi:hypothetical protein
MSEIPTDHLAAALPRVIRVHPGEVWPALTLDLDNGTSIHLEEGNRAALQLVGFDGLALLICWRPDVSAYNVSAALLPELAPYFPTG